MKKRRGEISPRLSYLAGNAKIPNVIPSEARDLLLKQPDMQLEVLLFAQYAEVLGPSIKVDVPDNTTAGTILSHVQARAAELGTRLPDAAMAVNQRYARRDDPVRGGDEVAVIPPVAGG
jgi:sulfur-carrier protein